MAKISLSNYFAMPRNAEINKDVNNTQKPLASGVTHCQNGPLFLFLQFQQNRQNGYFKKNEKLINYKIVPETEGITVFCA